MRNNNSNQILVLLSFMVGLGAGAGVTFIFMTYAKSISTPYVGGVILLVLLFALIYSYRVIINLIGRFRRQKIIIFWKKLKAILIEYEHKEELSDSRVSILEGNYMNVRKSLKNIMNHHHDEIHSYLLDKFDDPNVGVHIMEQFSHCFESKNLKEWKRLCLRKVPEELDCFDSLAMNIVNLGGPEDGLT